MNSKTDGHAYAALVSGCAIVDQPSREWLVVSGEDRVRFVNGFVTCDVRQLEPGDGVYGFFTSLQGRVLADVVITATGHELLLDTPSGRAQSLTDHMLRYKVADRVEVEVIENRSQIVVAGPESVTLLAQLLEQPPVDGKWACESDGGMALHRENRIGVAATRILGSERQVAVLSGRLEDAGALRAAEDVVSVVRIERGVPWFGVDFGEENFPQETGLESATVSYTKGCYLGQEIVARIHHRGHVNRHVRGLVGSGAVIESGSELFYAQERVGEVTSSAGSPALGSPIALAMVHRKAGDTVTLADGARLSLVELPFVKSA